MDFLFCSISPLQTFEIVVVLIILGFTGRHLYLLIMDHFLFSFLVFIPFFVVCFVTLIILSRIMLIDFSDRVHFCLEFNCRSIQIFCFIFLFFITEILIAYLILVFLGMGI